MAEREEGHAMRVQEAAARSKTGGRPGGIEVRVELGGALAPGTRQLPLLPLPAPSRSVGSLAVPPRRGQRGARQVGVLFGTC